MNKEENRNYGTQLAIAGGKGLDMFKGLEVVQEWLPGEMRTPYGEPSGKISLVNWEGGRFFCFSRHGDQQQLSPGNIPYLANCYALKSLGVKYWLSVSLSTHLKGRHEVGSVVVPDDYIAFNVNRRDQFFSHDTLPGLVLYIDNYQSSVSSLLKRHLSAAAREAGVPLDVNTNDLKDIDTEDMTVFAGVNGPQTGTLAEEKFLTAAFKHVVSGMTNMTESLVCAQAGISFAALNFVGGRGLNYGGVGRALAAYLAPETGGIDAKIVPILKTFVKHDLPFAEKRSLKEFLSMCTGGQHISQALEDGNAARKVDADLLAAVRVIAP